MLSRTSSANCKSPRRRGLSLVEVVFSALLVGVVLVGATDLLGSVIRGHSDNSDRAVGQQLALQLMTEILTQNFEDPNSPIFGPEADEQIGDRSSFDDIDDYDQWTSAQAEDAKGVQVLNSSGWVREVTVAYVLDPNNSPYGYGLKRITVDVLKNGEPVTQVMALESNL